MRVTILQFGGCVSLVAFSTFSGLLRFQRFVRQSSAASLTYQNSHQTTEQNSVRSFLFSSHKRTLVPAGGTFGIYCLFYYTRMLSSQRLLSQRAVSRRCFVGRTPTKRIKSTTSAAAMHETVERPTNKQLWRVFARAAVPMIGFGFTDQTVMLQAGNAIDCTLGVTFGLSTLVSSFD